MVSRREGIEAFGGTTKASVEGTTHTVRQEELTAFSLWINRYMKEGLMRIAFRLMYLHYGLGVCFCFRFVSFFCRTSRRLNPQGW